MIIREGRKGLCDRLLIHNEVVEKTRSIILLADFYKTFDTIELQYL